MSDRSPRPDFSVFTRWLAREEARLRPHAGAAEPDAPTNLLQAARNMRDEMLALRQGFVAPQGVLEPLRLMAAADAEPNVRPPELTTPRGFRVTLDFEEGTAASPSSIAVLVQGPDRLREQLVGQTVYLWSGRTRFELGQFDADGKALGTLPAGIEISLADFTSGNVQLEEPMLPDDD